MRKKHIIWFTGDERKIRDDMMDKLKASSQKPRRGRIRRPVDADGPRWTDRPRWTCAAARGPSRICAGAVRSGRSVLA